MDYPSWSKQPWVMLLCTERAALLCRWWLALRHSQADCSPNPGSIQHEDNAVVIPSNRIKKQQGEAPEQQPWTHTSVLLTNYCRTDPTWWTTETTIEQKENSHRPELQTPLLLVTYFQQAKLLVPEYNGFCPSDRGKKPKLYEQAWTSLSLPLLVHSCKH